MQLSLFPSEQEQIRIIDEAAEIVPPISAFSFSQEEIDNVLRLGSNTEHHRERIVAAFEEQKSIDEIADILKNLYHSGNGVGSVTAWYAEDGIHLSHKQSARYDKSAQVISWESAAERIGQLLKDGQFATNVELAEAEGYERKILAEQLWSLHHDLSDEAREAGYLKSLEENPRHGFPEESAWLAEQLKSPEFRQRLEEEYAAFLTGYRQDRGLLRFHYHRAEETGEALKDLSLPRITFSSERTEIPTVKQFITEDEINTALSNGSGVSGGKGRIFSFFQENHTDKEKADFLKHEYGIGGRSHALSRAGSSWEDYDGKGLGYRKEGCTDVLFTWEKVAKRISNLIQQGRYFTEEEQAEYDKIQEEKALAEADEIVDVNQEADAPVPAYDLGYGHLGNGITVWNRLEEEFGDYKTVAHINPDRTVTFYDDKMPENVREEILHEAATSTMTISATQDIPVFSTTPMEERQARLPDDLPTDEVLDEYPISIQVNGEWKTFPNAKAAEEASYREYKENLRRSAENYRITDDHLGEGGPKAKFQANVEAIKLLKYLEETTERATPEQQEILSRYVGWGGLADAFDPDKESWSKEYAQLKELLTPEEYTAARGSTLNAHYTSPMIIRAIYDTVGRMGFETGNILEPACGVGNFFGMLPESMAGSKLYGVELDSISGRIAKQLYPKANITVAGFETTDRRDFYDLAVGNVPFGQYQVNDPAYNKLGFSIHNYFFAKALDQVRPGGVVAFVTSRYTMDSKDSSVRRYLAQRAELLGAVRLPNNAFKANAGAEVVSDIIFLQKRERPIEIAPEWTQVGQTADRFTINQYFIDHPNMVLGNAVSQSTQYGRQDYTVEPIPGADLSHQLQAATRQIRGQITQQRLISAEVAPLRESIPADPNVRNYSYTLVDGAVYFREGATMTHISNLSATASDRVKGMIELRDCVRKLIDLQLEPGISDDTIKGQQDKLNQLYDAYTAKYGLINDRANRLVFRQDDGYYLLCALEVIDEDGKLERKADMFTKRTIKPHVPVTSVETAVEALAVSISEKAGVDLGYMASLTGKTEDEIVQELEGVIFRVPDSAQDGDHPRYVTADEYLSGNVRQKLRIAKQAAEKDPTFRVNVQALVDVQPKDLDASEIDVRLGATWIDAKYIQQFMYETFDTSPYLKHTIKVNYTSVTSEWQITCKTSVSQRDVAAYTTYGTSRANAYKILEDSLNLRDVRIYDTVEDADGKERRVLNGKETALAAQKQRAIRTAFQDWIWKDPERRQTLVRQYNEEMNAIRPREYDGSHIAFVGMNPEITLREHQRNAIARIIYGGNTLLAHEVGAGKTFEMVAAAMETKRLGLCEKSTFVVPNHLTGQWATDFLRLYPSANILVTTKEDFEKSNRKKFCARISTGDYDAIIIGHSQFEKIPISRERQERLLNEQINEITEGIAEVQASGGERFTVKQLERTRKSLEARLEKLQAEGRKDDVVTFEELGADRLFVDEAHAYKNLFLYTKMRNVAGLSTSDAQKSSDMFAKCRYMDEITDSRGVVFATGTPVDNSMTEVYTMQRYLQYDQLKAMDMVHFDCWIGHFGETVTVLELAPEGTGYRARTRLAHFYNLPELMNLFKEVADIKTADQLNLPTPKVKYHNVVAQPTAHQKEMVKALSERASKVHSGSVDPSQDNMLKITSDGRKLGLDQRIINPLLPDEPGTKVNQCVENILRIWRDGDADKLTQLVFCDISTPQKSTTKGSEQFTVYEDIRQKLIANGMPKNQIAFIHEANTDTKKKDLFSKVRSGRVRVLIGSTQKMGAGTNIQDRLVALHDLDCPWRPGDLEQRKGRIVRQGNRNKKVEIYRYVTEGTFDAYLWQTIENKQKFISQIMTSKSPVRSCDDADEQALSYAEIKALCAGDPRIKERMELDVEVAKLRMMKADYQSNLFRLQDFVTVSGPSQIRESELLIDGLKADIELLSSHPHPEDGFIGMEVQGQHFSKRGLAGEALLTACKQISSSDPVLVGEYRGFKISVQFNPLSQQHEVKLKGCLTHYVQLGDDGQGNVIRMDNMLNDLSNRLEKNQNHLADLLHQVEQAKEQLKKPFSQEEELQLKSSRLAELSAQLSLGENTVQDHLDQAIDIAGKFYDLVMEYAPENLVGCDRDEQISLTADCIRKGDTEEIQRLLTEIKTYGGTDEMVRKAGVLMDQIDTFFPRMEQREEEVAL